MRLTLYCTFSRVASTSPHAKLCRNHALLTRRCYSDATNRTYDDAINLLNTLQTPYAELKRQWDSGIKRGAEDLQHTKTCLSRLGYTGKDLNKLNVIHVAGTKGKGTVCAYVESILAQYQSWALSVPSNDPTRTRTLPPARPRSIGLYTSPHLISVRERIRLNSAPISEELFTKYFFQVWDKLCVPSELENDSVFPKPVYFRFLTLMSFHVFLSESVDVAIYETGMGGEYDATNVVERPLVTGISALGIDHTFHLGNSVEEIAWHKAGIFKKFVQAYTVQQPPAAMAVLSKRAHSIKVGGFRIVEENPLLQGVKIRPNEPFQRQNASLAIALSKYALIKLNPKRRVFPRPEDGLSKEIVPLPEKIVRGLEQVVSRGRCETKIDGNVTWYLDGAHTADSIVIASKWFCDKVADKPEPRVLIFNQQGHRESMELMEDLFASTKGRSKFDHVIFCPSVPPASSTRKDHVNFQTDLEAVASLTVQQKFADRWRELDSSQETTITVLHSLEEAFEYVKRIETHDNSEAGQEIAGERQKARVFITGSIHLVGRALGMLEGGIDAL
ncbi:related to folylpolyglutamate synthase [Phialocephala subalpina]|uniref:Folylpolyglutamate synthase n=1 Tax=Phialocephala subalpina TaxID=576137 RepID=A0A1L7WTF2_9HELO|nr:related to folylpolyglutamate synthase [Phialocephala subalpina]